MAYVYTAGPSSRGMGWRCGWTAADGHSGAPEPTCVRLAGGQRHAGPSGPPDPPLRLPHARPGPGAVRKHGSSAERAGGPGHLGYCRVPLRSLGKTLGLGAAGPQQARRPRHASAAARGVRTIRTADSEGRLQERGRGKERAAEPPSRRAGASGQHKPRVKGRAYPAPRAIKPGRGGARRRAPRARPRRAAAPPARGWGFVCGAGGGARPGTQCQLTAQTHLGDRRCLAPRSAASYNRVVGSKLV